VGYPKGAWCCIFLWLWSDVKSKSGRGSKSLPGIGLLNREKRGRREENGRKHGYYIHETDGRILILRRITTGRSSERSSRQLYLQVARDC
jgi:hypothetical protein